MALRPTPLALAFTLASVALCQERPDPVAYASFFVEVASLKTATGAPTTDLTGIHAIMRTAPKVQDVIGLSDADVEILTKIATDCVAATDSLQEPRRQLIFDSRLEFIETGKHSEVLEGKLKDLDERSDELVVNHVRQLKSALPGASFAKVDAYVRTPVSERNSLVVTIVRKPDSATANKPSTIPAKK